MSSDTAKKSGSSSRTPPNEQSALLPKSIDESTDEEILEEDGTLRTKARIIGKEFWILFKGSIPVILAYTLQNSLQTVSVLIVGRISPEALATAAFAYMFAMASGWLIALG